MKTSLNADNARMSGQIDGRASKWRRPRAVWAILLSGLQPGLGQIYGGFWRRGLLLLACWLGIELCGFALAALAPPTPRAVLGLVALATIAVGLTLFAGVDAGRRVRGITGSLSKPWFKSAWFTAVVVLAINVALPDFGWRSFSIPNASNEPTLMIGDRLFASVRDAGKPVTRGSMVVFASPRRPWLSYVKRVIGLPGDHVRLRNGLLELNGQTVERRPAGERVLDGSGTSHLYVETLDGHVYSIAKSTDEGWKNNTPDYVVPDDSFFALGDNRDDSLDSRFSEVGSIPFSKVIGAAATVYWGRDWSRVLRAID